MISLKQINEEYVDLCYVLDSDTISLWSKRQWANEFKKENINIIGLYLSNLLIGICVFHLILDEAQINYFVIKKRFRQKRFGSYLMNYLIEQCKKSNVNKLGV